MGRNYGIELLPNGKRRTELLAGAERRFAQVLANRILAFEELSAPHSRELPSPAGEAVVPWWSWLHKSPRSLRFMVLLGDAQNTRL